MTEDLSDPKRKLCEPVQYGASLAINLHKLEQPKPQGEITPTRAQQ